MSEFFFYLFSAITLGCGIAVVFSRNPVNAAMFLILSFLGMASLFVMLEAYFLAVIQVLVYAGAVVVLFLFIVMLLDVKQESQIHFKIINIVASVLGFAILLTGVAVVTSSDAVSKPIESLPAMTDNALKTFGYELFTTYLLPMQVTGFLLLVAMIGVIVLSKRLKVDEAARAK